jgi:hypothetical protein
MHAYVGLGILNQPAPQSLIAHVYVPREKKKKATQLTETPQKQDPNSVKSIISAPHGAHNNIANEPFHPRNSLPPKSH